MTDDIINGGEKHCSVKWDGDRGWFVLTMPDGTVISKQTKIVVEDCFPERGLYKVTVTVTINTYE